MAFWKKSDDPWDRKPTSTSYTTFDETPGKEEKGFWESIRDDVTEWQEKKKAAAQGEADMPQESCPWCGQPMLWGNLFGSSRGWGMTWEEGRKKSFLESIGTSGQAKRFDLGHCEEAWYCTECRKLVLDIEAAMKTAGPSVVWVNGKPVPQFVEEEKTNDL